MKNYLNSRRLITANCKKKVLSISAFFAILLSVFLTGNLIAQPVPLNPCMAENDCSGSLWGIFDLSFGVYIYNSTHDTILAECIDTVWYRYRDNKCTGKYEFIIDSLYGCDTSITNDNLKFIIGQARANIIIDNMKGKSPLDSGYTTLTNVFVYCAGCFRKVCYTNPNHQTSTRKKDEGKIGMSQSRGGPQSYKVNGGIGESDRYYPVYTCKYIPCPDFACCATRYRVIFQDGIINPSPQVIDEIRYGPIGCPTVQEGNKTVQCKSVCD
jgi:hypothetical protein